MHNGDCYSNGSYFGDGEIKPTLLECGLSGSAFNGGEWFGPNGRVPCPGSNSNLHCANTSNGSDASLSVHIPNNSGTHLEIAGDGWYKCCLPTNCSDSDGTNIIFANIFSKNAINEIKIISHFVEFAQIVSFTEPDLPSNMTVYPQEFTLHCVKTGYYLYNFKINIGNTALASYTECDSSEINCGDIKILYSSNHTVEHTITVSWDGKTISRGSVKQSFTGDQDYQCTVKVANQPIRMRSVTIQGIKPFFSY